MKVLSAIKPKPFSRQTSIGLPLLVAPLVVSLILQIQPSHVLAKEDITRKLYYQQKPPRAYGTIPGKPCFRSYKGMMESMSDLVVRFPSLIKRFDIGISYLRTNLRREEDEYELPPGYNIYAWRITSNRGKIPSSEKAKMLITSGVHPREIAPPELLARFVEHMVRNYGEVADITWILERTEIHAILYVNPDGRYMAENYPDLWWRKNLNPGPPTRNGGFECQYDAYGVDINRNFDFMWGDRSGSSDYPCANDYHGTDPLSEPEARALVRYAKSLFPEEQRKDYPEEEKDVPFGEGITGMYVDIHGGGESVYYPWGHKDEVSPDDEALQALARKIRHFNGYKLWAGGQPDFLYPTSGDTVDFMYAVLGVAAYGLEIGYVYYESCDAFENEIFTRNLPALVYTAKLAETPYRTIKGPDILSMNAETLEDMVRFTVLANDKKMVAINDFPDHSTGDQTITKVKLFLDVHPNDYSRGDIAWEMNAKSEYIFALSVKKSTLKRRRHTLYAQAMDSDGYNGPVSSIFFEKDAKEAIEHG